ncbi:MAG: adenine nucleotide alpha hydrolase [Thermoplasmata archaeon]|nr:adenine nucleotide alpha hydrolase [Thermoplasmata archaeon]
MSVPRAVVAWSTGKDAAFALEEVRGSGSYEIVGLLTTVTEPYARVSMHGVRTELLELQAERLGFPLHRVPIPAPCPNSVYEAAMAEALGQLRADGVNHVIFGDLFLVDVRRYREDRMAGTGVAPVFPLWGRSTLDLAREMLTRGLRATVSCVDPRRLSASFAGRDFDERFLADLPPDVDPCGENGEFHTFVYDLPAFGTAIKIRRGSVVERDGFVFADLLPDGSPGPTVPQDGPTHSRVVENGAMGTMGSRRK